MSGARSHALLAAAAVAIAAAAAAQEPPGTPKPSRGAPGDRPGTGDAFGTQGGEALRRQSPAEGRAARVQETVERIDVTGVHHTREDVIRDHLSIAVGRPLTPDAILESRVRLFQLGTFSRVEVETAPGSAPGRVIVRVHVVETALVSISDFTVAHTPVSPLYGAFGLSYGSVAGLGFGTSVTAALDGQGRHGFRMTLYDPELAGRSWVAGLEATWQEGLESACETVRCGGDFSAIPWVRYSRVGGQIDSGWRPGVFSRILLGYRFEHVEARTDRGAFADARPPVREGSSTVSALVLGYDEDSRDDPFLPTGGQRIEAHLTIATTALGSSYEYSRYLVEGERWFALGRGRAVRVDAAVGLVQGDAPFFDRFYAADWSYFSVGYAAPRLLELNFSPDSRYDALLAVLGGEYDVSLWDAPGKVLRRGVLALGIRGVYTARTPSSGRSLLSLTPVSVDAALRMDTSYGVVGIGLGYVTDQILKSLPLHVPGVQYR